VTLYFVKGRARVGAGGDEMIVNEGAFLYLNPGTEHAIQAETDVVMLLTLVK
jgi:quercetin dioxygenase-like cupin family protein